MLETSIITGSYYKRLGKGRYESTLHAQGAWNPHEQHMAPVTGLMVREMETFAARKGMRLAQLSFDILGLIPAGEFTIEVTMARPGKTIELLQAELTAGGRVAVRATAWRLQISDTAAVAACEDEAMAPRSEGTDWDGLAYWPGGFIQSLQAKVLPEHRPGRGAVWIHSPFGMVDDEPTSALVRLLGLVDSANGVSSRVPPGPGSYMFPNVDLSVHLYREPEGEWLGLQTRVTFAGDGVGLTSAVLHDEHGPFGRSEQILTIRRLTDGQ